MPPSVKISPLPSDLVNREEVGCRSREATAPLLEMRRRLLLTPPLLLTAGEWRAERGGEAEEGEGGRQGRERRGRRI